MAWDGTIDRDEFIAWLKTKKPCSRFATACRSTKCPFALFIIETKGPFCALYISRSAIIIRRIINEGDVDFPWCVELPVWAINTIYRIDHDENNARTERKISPREVLAILQEQENAG